MVVVAQLVEPRIVIPVVVGSSPIVHPIKEEERVGIGPNILIPALAVLPQWSRKDKIVTRLLQSKTK